MGSRAAHRGMEAVLQPPWDTGRKIFSLKLPGSTTASLAPLLLKGSLLPLFAGPGGLGAERSVAGSPWVMLLGCCRCHPHR